MADHIPFVYGSQDRQLTRRYFSDSEVVRLQVNSEQDNRSPSYPRSKIWVDAGVDGYHRWPDVNPSWKRFFKQLPGADKLGYRSFHERPDKKALEEFVFALLDKCNSWDPDWLSVPQLPLVKDSSRNKVNRELANATAKWKTKSRFRGSLVLPVIVTHQDQIKLKTERNKRLKLISQSFDRSEADGWWVVDSSLSDWTGSRTYERTRFKAIIQFHEELKESLPHKTFSIAGPYWALNLVLWARGLVEYPAIGVGARYQYLIPSGTANPPKRRVALGPLRRTAIVSSKLEEWLEELPKTIEFRELRALLQDKRPLRFNEAARAQVAKFYKRWFDEIASAKPSGRALALFQDFSSAYVLGKSLSNLPSEEKTARRPERLAEQFMFFCMPTS